MTCPENKKRTITLVLFSVREIKQLPQNRVRAALRCHAGPGRRGAGSDPRPAAFPAAVPRRLPSAGTSPRSSTSRVSDMTLGTRRCWS